MRCPACQTHPIVPCAVAGLYECRGPDGHGCGWSGPRPRPLHCRPGVPCSHPNKTPAQHPCHRCPDYPVDVASVQAHLAAASRVDGSLPEVDRWGKWCQETGPQWNPEVAAWIEADVARAVRAVETR